MDTWKQVDVVGSLGPTWQRRSAPQGRRPAPQAAMPRHRSVGVAPESMTSVHSSQFDQWPQFDDGGSMGPLS